MVAAVQLKHKFDPYILNKAKEPEQQKLCLQLDAIFAAPNNSHEFKPVGGKAHVLKHQALPGWIIKKTRCDGLNFIADQNIYRVRKALRIQQVIEKHHFTETVGTKEFIYEHNGEWLVISEELPLAANVVVKQEDDILARLYRNKNEIVRPLTPQQAKEHAVICFEANLGDIHVGNLMYTVDGKVALVDPEPVDRAAKKVWWRRILYLFPRIKASEQFILNNTSAAHLAACCTDPKAAEEVEKVRCRKLLKEVAKCVIYAVLPVIASLGLLALSTATVNPAGISLAGYALTAAKINANIQIINIYKLISNHILSHTEIGQQMLGIK